MAKTQKEMIDFVIDKIITNSKNGRVYSGGQYMVFVKDVWFDNEKLTNAEASKIIEKAVKKLGLDPSKRTFGL